MGALTATGIPDVRRPFEPLFPGGCHVANTNRYRPEVEDPAEAIYERILLEGPETVSCVILEPVQNSGGCFTPPEGYFQRVREICDEFGIVFISDEVICSWGRLGTYFGAEKYDYQPDIITTAKGITSSYAPMGAVIASDRIFEPFSTGRTRSPTGSRSAATRSPRRSRSRTSTCSPTRASSRTCSSTRTRSRRCSTACATCRSSATCAGRATSARSSSCATRRPRRRSPATRRSGCCAASSRPEMFKRGLICRADDRGDPVIQFSPPLIAGPEQFEEMHSVLRPVLEEACERLHLGG